MKAKKVLAMLMASAMIMGTSVTAFAATATTGDVTVKGLVKENTQVEIFKVISADANVNNWVVEDWAEDYVEINENNEYVFDWNGLYAHLPETATDTATTSTGTANFDELALGGYVVKATSLVTGSVTVYTVMGTENYTYDATTHLMKGEDATVYAKSTTIPVDKSSDDNFIAKGQTVTFTVTTTFPSFTDEEMDLKPAPSYKLIDIPDGLKITGVTSVTIGDDTISGITGAYDTTPGKEDNYVIDLSSEIKEANFGQTVTVTYTAEVTSAKGYSNTANFIKNDKEIGEDTDKGYTAILNVKKLGEGEETLSGAVFNVYVGDKKEGEPLYFTGSNGVYELADSTTPGATTDITTIADGTVQVKGLAEGKYFFDEKEAPEGYSINTDGVKFEITKEAAEVAEDNIEMSKNLVDTKLASLPSTGGIGTTIFTIGGCAIMVTAAGLYFATRKKTEK